MGQALPVYLLTLACTLLSQFYSRTVYLPTQPCPPGATCAAPVQEMGWPLPWITTALHPADEPLDLAAVGLGPWGALIADLIFYSLLIVLIGQVLRLGGRWRQRG